LKTVKNATEPADADAMFAAVQARSNRQIQKQLNPTRSIAIRRSRELPQRVNFYRNPMSALCLLIGPLPT
jgi:hypothetical protein